MWRSKKAREKCTLFEAKNVVKKIASGSAVGEAALSYSQLHRMVADIKRRREAISYAAGVDC